MTAKRAKTSIISFNNNTPLVESNPGETPIESLKLRILVKSDHISPKLVNIIFLGTWGKFQCYTQNPSEISIQKNGKMINNKLCGGSSYKL